MSPEKMFGIVLAGTDQDFSQELLAAFQNRFPIDYLRLLLRSEKPETLGLGSYLIYELGAKARGLLEDIVPLLSNRDPQIRGDAINALKDCMTKFDALALGKVLEKLADPDPFVQRTAMRFVQSCEQSLLVTGVFRAAEMNPGTVFEELPGFITKTTFSLRRSVPVTSHTLVRLLRHQSPVARRFGAALATRPRFIVDETYLDLASDMDEKECRNLVAWARERPCLSHAETRKL